MRGLRERPRPATVQRLLRQARSRSRGRARARARAFARFGFYGESRINLFSSIPRRARRGGTFLIRAVVGLNPSRDPDVSGRLRILRTQVRCSTNSDLPLSRVHHRCFFLHLQYQSCL